ncbi:MAG: Gfo/Idh/MocA family oxidoreductase [Rhodobacteraceae bacterium]|nr:Gfo/Idh/MocA family oxidoreductase [Paracoccaceae bacterium]
MGLTGTNVYPAASRRLRLGIVGGGGSGLVGKWHWTGARLSNRWELVAGALSSNPAKAAHYGREWMLPADRTYSTYHDMARIEGSRADGIEAVAICTPNWTHRAIAEAFMDVGIDIICDKPITTTNEDAAALVKRQRETALVFAVTHPYAFHSMVRQARDMINSGAIGQVRQILVEYAQEWATEHDDPESGSLAWRRDPAKVGRASAAADIGTHALHLIEFVSIQNVQQLRADFHVCGAPKAMEDTAFLGLRFRHGVPGSMWITQAAPGNYCGLRFRIYGRRGGLEWDQEAPEQLMYQPLNEPRQTIVRGHGSGVLPSAERMAQLPRGHGEALSDAWSNLYTEMAIAVEARRNGRTVPKGLIAVPNVDDGARGVRFFNAAADSHEAGGVWVDLD